MQRLCAGLFCLLLLSTGMKDLIVYLVYVSNMDYVAERFCQNTDQLSCKGRCFLTEIFGQGNTEREEFPKLPTPSEKISFFASKTSLFKLRTFKPSSSLNIKQNSFFIFFGLAPPTPPPRPFVV